MVWKVFALPKYRRPIGIKNRSCHLQFLSLPRTSKPVFAFYTCQLCGARLGSRGHHEHRLALSCQPTPERGKLKVES